MDSVSNAAFEAFGSVLNNGVNRPHVRRYDMAWHPDRQCVHICIDHHLSSLSHVSHLSYRDDVEDFYQSLIDTAVHIMSGDDDVRAIAIEFDACCYIHVHPSTSSTFVVTRGDIQSPVTVTQTIDMQHLSRWDDITVSRDGGCTVRETSC